MRKSLTIFLAAGLLLYPFATFAADYGSQSSSNQQAPPVAQPLVREGDFSIKLAAVLDLGTPENEAEAESLLAKAGVAPLNGWISDYPVTPEILGQIQDAASKAASEGKLTMTAEESSRGIASLASQMNLPTPAGAEAQGEGSNPPAASSPTVVNNYYYDNGPPIVTYYPPPADYVYLYDWVPYPVWWFGFWFPGFFICHTFTTVVVVNSAPVLVTNQIFNPFTRTVVLVSPVVVTRTGSVRPFTVLRAEGGRTFRTLADMRKDSGTAGTTARSSFRNRGFRSPEARKSAGNIFSGSVDRMRDRRGNEGRMIRGGEGRHASSSPAARSYRRPVTRGNGEGRTYAPRSSDRSFNGPAMRSSELRSGWRGRSGTMSNSSWRRRGEDRTFGAAGSSRSFSGQSAAGSRWAKRSFSGSGRQMR